jgi:hypothetical protein
LERVDRSVNNAEIAATYLNLSAVLIELQNSQDACRTALRAVMLLQLHLKKIQMILPLYDVPLD